MTLLVLAVSGGVGAVLRFVVDTLVARRNPLRVPLGTFVINVTGSLLLGLLTGWAAQRGDSADGAWIATVVGGGLCGGYTTFSTASVETVRLWFAEGSRLGAGYAAATLVAGVLAAALGMGIGSLF